MGTMRNNFEAAFIILILMLSSSRSLFLHDNENSSKRNSLPDTLTPESPSKFNSIHECLFINPNLPICDVEWMLNSEEDSKSNKNLFSGEVEQRLKRNVDDSTMGVVVYTFEGCLPLRLPFSMPSCEGISMDRIVDIQTFRSFAVKGVTKPPLVFPKFNYFKWRLMMTRLRNRVSSKTREDIRNQIYLYQEGPRNSVEASVEKSVQDRMVELGKASATKETIRSAITRSIDNSNSPKASIPNDAKSSESAEKVQKVIENTSSVENIASSSSSSSESEELPPSILRFHNHVDSMPKDSHDDSRAKSYDRKTSTPATIPEIPTLAAFPEDQPMHEHSVMEKSSNRLLIDRNFGEFPHLMPNVQTGEGDNLIAYDLPFPEMTVGTFKRRREIRLPSSMQGIVDEHNPREIAGKAIERRLQFPQENLNSKQFADAFRKQRKISKSLKLDEGIASDTTVPKFAIPEYNAESRLVSLKKDSRGKIDALGGSKATWRKNGHKKTTSRKKYRNHMVLKSSRSQ